MRARCLQVGPHADTCFVHDQCAKNESQRCSRKVGESQLLGSVLGLIVPARVLLPGAHQKGNRMRISRPFQNLPKSMSENHFDFDSQIYQNNSKTNMFSKTTRNLTKIMSPHPMASMLSASRWACWQHEATYSTLITVR